MAKQKITTIEGLAELINGTMASKEDIRALEDRVNTRFDAVKSRLDTLDGRVDTLDARLERIEADVHTLRDDMIHRREWEDVRDRVTYIEKKLGIESGV
jgi:predicted nuclease with TOPRIM domain